MRKVDIDGWSFSRSEAAEIIGVTDTQLGNWLNRYGLLPHKKRGTGWAIGFTIRDLMSVGAMKLLVDLGLEPAKAAAALAPYQSPFGAMFRPVGAFAHYPGTIAFALTKDGGLVSVDGPEVTVSVQLRAWPLYDRIFPKMKAAILAAPRGYDLDEVKAGLEAFEALVEDQRRRLFAEPEE